jgi:hypothetical protein
MTLDLRVPYDDEVNNDGGEAAELILSPLSLSTSLPTLLTPLVLL